MERGAGHGALSRLCAACAFELVFPGGELGRGLGYVRLCLCAERGPKGEFRGEEVGISFRSAVFA